MLAGRRGQRRVRRMELVRRRDIDRIDFSVRAQLLERCKGGRGKLLGKSPARFRARIGRGDQRHALILPEGRQHHHEGAAEPGHAEAEPLALCRISHGGRSR